MVYDLIPTKTLLEQLKSLDKKAKRIIQNKILLLKENPFLNKRLSGFHFPLFRIRFKNHNAESRLIYSVEGAKVVLICLLDRRKDYKDLLKFLKKEGIL